MFKVICWNAFQSSGLRHDQGIPQDNLAWLWVPMGPGKRLPPPCQWFHENISLFFSLVDSEKSLSPLVDETQPFTVPFRPYDWSSYPGVALRPPLVQQSLHPSSMEMDGRPAPVNFYIDRSRASLYAERTVCEDPYGDYGRTTAALLFRDRGLGAKAHSVQAQPELLCPNLLLNSAYKCVKCTKVRISLWNKIILY